MQSLRFVQLYGRRLALSAVEDVRQRYAGSILGSLWAVLYPVATLAFYMIIYVYIFKIRPNTLDEYGYVVLVTSGLIPLMAFSECLSAGAGSLVAQRNLLLNTVFPAELIPLRAVLALQTPSLCGLAIVLIGAAALGRIAWSAVVLVPVLWTLLLMFIAGVVWTLSLISLVFRDIQHVLGLICMSATVLSPAAYTPEMVPNGLKFIIYANPLSYYVLSFQDLVCYGRVPPLSYLTAVITLAFASFGFGAWFFKRTKYVFFDYA